MNKYICAKCKNEKDFYCEVSVVGRLKFNTNTGKTEGKVYGIDSTKIDNEFLTVYCSKCGEDIGD